ncbi:MAG: MauE/DoxX family redox-associated membrane protein [Solitalea-like symbiont of Acarus siro]
MQLLIQILRILLGLIFLFSGLIKQNDPLGFAYKLEEYCHVFNLHILIPYTLPLSILFCALEISLGVLLIFKINFNLAKKISLLLLIFFAFLTFYSAYFDKVKSCGCFGDVIVLTPWQSFFKDVVLLVINLSLFYIPKIYYRPVKQYFYTLIIFLISLYLGLYTYKNLPAIDFSQYKKGVSLRDLYNHKLLDPLALDSNWHDHTQEIVNNTRLVILITSLDLNTLKNKDIAKINSILKQAELIKTPVYILTSANDTDIKNFKTKIQITLETYFTDLIFLRTLMRANNGIIILKNGIIMSKNNLANFNINALK